MAKNHYVKSDELDTGEKMLLSLHSNFRDLVSQLHEQYHSQRGQMVTNLSMAGIKINNDVLEASRSLEDKIFVE